MLTHVCWGASIAWFPVSQDQTTTVLFFRCRCVVLKFSGPDNNCLGGRCLVLKFQDQRTTKQCGRSLVLVVVWSCYTGPRGPRAAGPGPTQRCAVRKHSLPTTPDSPEVLLTQAQPLRFPCNSPWNPQRPLGVNIFSCVWFSNAFMCLLLNNRHITHSAFIICCCALLHCGFCSVCDMRRVLRRRCCHANTAQVGHHDDRS